MKNNQIDITTEALEFLLKNPESTAKLRVGVVGGKCSGYAYVIEWSSAGQSPKDLVFEFGSDEHKLIVIIDKKSIIYLNGTLIDWEESLMAHGFKFNNPNVSATCGCGSSISFKE